MTTIAVLPDAAGHEFRAVSGDHLGVGGTVGEAIDRVSAELGSTRQTTLVVVQPREPDAHFTAEQRDRLERLMADWRAARDRGATLPPAAQAELDGLIAAEVHGATARAAELIAGLPT